MKSINLKLSDDDYRKLKWISDRLELSVTETLRKLIPNIEITEASLVKDREISSASPHDLVPIAKLSDKDRQRLRGYLNELLEKRWAVTLANEIKQQLLDKEGSYLTVSTFKRISRWANPYRQTEREEYVLPRAKAISQLLFGKDIERFD